MICILGSFQGASCAAHGRAAEVGLRCLRLVPGSNLPAGRAPFGGLQNEREPHVHLIQPLHVFFWGHLLAIKLGNSIPMQPFDWIKK
jgi:hypothetical protein